MTRTERVSSTRLPRPLLVLTLATSLSLFPDTADAHESLATHMTFHIVVMNVLAPVGALGLLGFGVIPTLGAVAGRTLLAATLVQIIALWALHSPALLTAALLSAHAFFLAQAVLFFVALWFWLAVLSQPPREFWRGSFALLMTGKLFCLLGALFVFSPRALYSGMQICSTGADPAISASQDQQLAGLMMLIACPFSYVLAGIVLASRALRKLETDDAQLSERAAP
ncbi:MAG: cytochrome c oxidase assembly protein [Pseudorhodoplanes sp.]|uniref:cytochrome c oxidase assembly protein n=1 Tax=Pseudorhodoplanes sp. TaxID=1934341 RepID=UPI003D11692F